MSITHASPQHPHPAQTPTRLHGDNPNASELTLGLRPVLHKTEFKPQPLTLTELGYWRQRISQRRQSQVRQP